MEVGMEHGNTFLLMFNSMTCVLLLYDYTLYALYRYDEHLLHAYYCENKTRN